ncbi:hypothetical protein MAQA_15771 [Listeria aquatica FSL S10-1188]|uniref:Uncharacterized protein n=1 Tax=Listeria aquatica FSL S10-1188 TaxID=1265818 RepID=W7AMY6_9LIST|nr:hypothetical protein MAQA_15771 [Listeria aquatica FSL S10-1188]
MFTFLTSLVAFLVPILIGGGLFWLCGFATGVNKFSDRYLYLFIKISGITALISAITAMTISIFFTLYLQK